MSLIDPCKICSANNWTVAYEGPVRHGTFGRTITAAVYRCAECGVEFLPPIVQDLDVYYKSGAYRDEIGESPDVLDYFARHDAEQLPKYALLEEIPLRGQIVADVGCAGGSFLDGVRGFAATTIGIEPTTAYHDSLRERNHKVYPDVTSALTEWRGRVNLVTCFSVIEHVEYPVGFLQSVRALLANNGQILLSTPNRRDILLEMGSDAYKIFFYRVAHTYYFEHDSLHRAVQAAGFSSFRAKYVHRFNYANFVAWLRDGKPTGNKGESILGAGFNRLWQSVLEERGRSDYLYAYFF